jgi:hypothetical protein
MNDMESERRFGWGAIGIVILALLLIVGAVYFGIVYFGGTEETADLPPLPTVDVTLDVNLPTQEVAEATGTGASLALSPPAGASGEAITATGAGFPPDSTIIFLMGPAVEGADTQEIGRTTADAAGAFVFALGLPDVWPKDESPITDGVYTIVAATEDGSAQAAANLEYSADAEPDGTGEPLPTSEADMLVYTNDLYGVTFSYPATWIGVPGDPNSAEGPDGFFVIDAAGSSDTDLTALCESQNNPDLLPYGTAPTITYITVAGQPACLIMPSADQSAEMNGQAALIVTYPAPVTLDDGVPYYYFVLYADQTHIMAPMADTLTFLPE